eukprot:9219483-Prorocentrum_lima.AAC.1
MGGDWSKATKKKEKEEEETAQVEAASSLGRGCKGRWSLGRSMQSCEGEVHGGDPTAQGDQPPDA